MDRRFSRAEKGKGQEVPELPAKRPPVRIPANDNEDLIASNRLTLIGKLTNPQVQKPLRAVIDFMVHVWNLEGRIVGRALGLDKFQFKFESEHDLQYVLENGPYHYKRWMLLLQRWEPIVSDNFPSKISFNVRIHGIPLHFWSEVTIHPIGKELGTYKIKDVKEAKIWVEVNGLEPLVMKLEIELPTAEIAEVELEYIRIEKHCFTCFSLFHEEAICPYRSINDPPPKERELGITQRIALQRIEADKKRHDDRRGYRRPDAPRSISHVQEEYTVQSGRDRGHRSGYSRHEGYGREHSILSRTARPNTGYERSKTSSFQYRVVEKGRHHTDSSVPQTRVEEPDLRNSLPSATRNVLPVLAEAETETTPIRTVKDRLGGFSNSKDFSNGSKDRRSALKRLSDPNPPRDTSTRKAPSTPNS